MTAEDVDTYTQAQCWVLAWHLLQELAGVCPAAIVDLDEHVLVQLEGEDRYLDVMGLHTRAELAAVWGSAVDRLRPIGYDLGRYILPDPQHPENVRAREVARVLVARYLPEDALAR